MATSLEWVETLKTRFQDKIIGYRESAPGEPEIMVAAKDAKEMLEALKNFDGGPFEHLADLTAYDDYPKNPRFYVVYELISMTRKQRCSVLVPAEVLDDNRPLAAAPVVTVTGTLTQTIDTAGAVSDRPVASARYAVPTITDLWKGAGWLERETYDLVGVEFTGHPDMRRILLPEQFVGHPLQKDFTLDYRQQFAETDSDAPVFDPFGNTLIEKSED